MSDLTIPEEGIERAAIRQAGLAAGDEGQWRAYWNYDHTLSRWTCGCDPMLAGLAEAGEMTSNIAVTVGHALQRPDCGWPADNSQRGLCGQPGATMVLVNTFDGPPLAALRAGEEKPSVLVLCAEHGRAFGAPT